MDVRVMHLIFVSFMTVLNSSGVECASKIKFKKANRKRTVTVRRVLFFISQCNQIRDGCLEIFNGYYEKNHPSNCNRSLLICFFQFDLGSTS